MQRRNRSPLMATIRIPGYPGNPWSEGEAVKHRCSAYLNRRIKRDHRGVKQRYYPMLGSGALPSAQRFGRGFEEVRQYFRPRSKQNEVISLPVTRRQFLYRELELEALFLEA